MKENLIKYVLLWDELKRKKTTAYLPEVVGELYATLYGVPYKHSNCSSCNSSILTNLHKTYIKIRDEAHTQIEAEAKVKLETEQIEILEKQKEVGTIKNIEENGTTRRKTNKKRKTKAVRERDTDV